MIRLQMVTPNSLQDAQAMLQTAVGVEFGTLPPYLYSLYSILPDKNPEARRRIKSVVLQEMVHMCLACNILNALGGDPQLRPPRYPGPLPGDIGPNGTPLTLHLLPFSRKAMEQAMLIEQPEDPPHFPVRTDAVAAVAGPKAVTIGEFYSLLDRFLATLPENTWKKGRNQIFDDQFFAGQIFPINSYPDAHKAIEEIISEGEGSHQGKLANPIDFQGEVAHYYRFGEMFHDRVLTKDNNAEGYAWGPARLGVNWADVFPAISDPGSHDFSKDSPAARATQLACNQSYSTMVDALQRTVSGTSGALGQAVQAMFRLRTAAMHAFTIPLSDPFKVAGPAFTYMQAQKGE